MFAERNLGGDASHWRSRFSRLALLAAFATVQMASRSGASVQSPLTAPGVDLQGANVYTFYVGRLQITALSDGTVPGDMHQLLRDTTDRRTDGLLPSNGSPRGGTTSVERSLCATSATWQVANKTYRVQCVGTRRP